MVYLEPSEYARFGLDDETGEELVVSASAMVDAFCRRESLGLAQCTERLRFAPGVRSAMVSNTPVASVVSARVRLRERWSVLFADPLEAAVAAFGVEGQWRDVAVEQISFTASGEVEIAGNVLGTMFDEAEVVYTAGWSVVPDAVKVACAQIVRNAQAQPALNVKRGGVDAMQMEYFGASLMDDEVKRMLRPYMATRLG